MLGPYSTNDQTPPAANDLISAAFWATASKMLMAITSTCKGSVNESCSVNVKGSHCNPKITSHWSEDVWGLVWLMMLGDPWDPSCSCCCSTHLMCMWKQVDTQTICMYYIYIYLQRCFLPINPLANSTPRATSQNSCHHWSWCQSGNSELRVHALRCLSLPNHPILWWTGERQSWHV